MIYLLIYLVSVVVTWVEFKLWLTFNPERAPMEPIDLLWIFAPVLNTITVVVFPIVMAYVSGFGEWIVRFLKLDK